MRTSLKKALIIISIMTLFSIVNFFIPSVFTGGKYLILLGAMLGVLYYLIGVDFSRKSNDVIILRNILIYVVSYYLIVYLSGLYLGFVKTIYSYTLNNLTMNIFPSILSIIAVEIIRGELIYKTKNNKWIIIFSCIAFVLFEVSINFVFYDLRIQDNLYQFIGLLILPSIAKNILMSVIHSKTDKYPAMVYRFAMETIGFVLLIEPNTGPYIKSVLLILLPILVGLMVLGTERKVKSAPENAKRSAKVYFVLIVFLLLVVLINSGLVKYQSLVIGSNSMKDYLEKGDVILIEQTKNHDKFKVGDVMAFYYDGKVIVHRIVLKETRNGEIYYKTKGDNNEKEDSTFISQKMIKGKVLGRMKFIGLPSVWLSELFG